MADPEVQMGLLERSLMIVICTILEIGPSSGPRQGRPIRELDPLRRSVYQF